MMDIHTLSEWTALISFVLISAFAVYKYTKQNRDYKW